MQLGMFMQPVHDPKRDYGQVLEEDRQSAILADQLGYSEVYVGEHVAATVEPIASPLTFLATVIHETKLVKFGTGVFCLPQQHPAAVAANAALFDHLAKGRFIMGVGPGALSSDLELFKTAGPEPRGDDGRVVEHDPLDLARRAALRHQGRILGSLASGHAADRIQAIGALPKPYQQPHPPIAISIMSPNSPTAKLAGEQDWIPISGASFIQPRYVASHWEQYVLGCEKARAPARPQGLAGLPLDSSSPTATKKPRTTCSTPTAPSPSGSAISAARSRSGIRLHLFRPDGREEDESVTWQDVAKSQVAYGSPKTVLEKLVALRETVGDFGTLIQTAHEWTDEAFARRSMTKLAEEVMPRLTQHASASRAAE